MAEEKGRDLTDEEIKNLKLIQHNMALEGHEISLDELVEVKKQSLADGDEEKIEAIISKAKREGISQLEAARKYFFNEGTASDE